MIWAFTILIMLLAVIYAGMFLYFIKGWDKLDVFKPYMHTPENAFSILIPARNEERNITACIESIVKQQYDNTKFEILVIDDFSEDNTAAQVDVCKQKYPDINIHIYELAKMLSSAESINSYKKQAISEGISRSQFEWIITTDADCIRGENWLSTINSFIHVHGNVKLVSAPVKFSFSNNFFEKSQALEFGGLIGIGAACLEQKTPNMCNGANLIYRKLIYEEVNGFKGFDDIASGDDEFLMHKIFAKYPQDVLFLKSTNAIVSTPALNDFGGFIQQRKRWASKGRKYADKRISLIMASAFLFYVMIFTGLIAGFCNPVYWLVTCIAIFFKIIPEGIFLSKTSRFLNQKNLINYYLPAVLFQMAYVIFIGIYGNFGKYNWKGRKVQ